VCMSVCVYVCVSVCVYVRTFIGESTAGYWVVLLSFKSTRGSTGGQRATKE
jgi:hypothetical protein